MAQQGGIENALLPVHELYQKLVAEFRGHDPDLAYCGELLDKIKVSHSLIPSSHSFHFMSAESLPSSTILDLKDAYKLAHHAFLRPS